MRPCPACKASVADDHRFCGYCGARVDASGPELPSAIDLVPHASGSDPGLSPPAGAKPASEASAAPAAPKPSGAVPSPVHLLGAKTRPEAPLSPLAQSAVMDSPVQPRVRTAPTPAVAATASHMNMPRVKRESTEPPGMRRGLAVMVTWSDGRKYPGALERIEGGQCLVVFPDGQQRWLDRALVEFVKA